MSLRLSVLSVAPLYTAVVAQDHASSKTFARLVTKAMPVLFLSVGSILDVVACCLDSVYYPLRLWL